MLDEGYDGWKSWIQLLSNPVEGSTVAGDMVSLGEVKKRGILNNRKEILMATKKITEIILYNSLRLFCLKFRHTVQYPEPLKEKVIIENGSRQYNFE
jgi:hypothetical protein